MPGTKNRIRRTAAAVTDVDAAHLQYLVRAIVEATGSRNERNSKGEDRGTHESVVVDTDLDGVRYLLIRMPLVDPAREMLSPREFEIVRMVAKGYQNKIIAGILNISTWTVCAHMRRVFAKFGVSSRAAMVAKLLETDIGLQSSLGAAAPDGNTAVRGPRSANAIAPWPRGKAVLESLEPARFESESAATEPPAKRGPVGAGDRRVLLGSRHAQG